VAWSRPKLRTEELTMRRLIAAALAAAMIVPVAARAGDIDAATMAAVLAAASKGYPATAKPEIRNVVPSRAKNGRGYCGEVTTADGSGFTLFHAILGDAANPTSVLRLADYPDPDNNANAAAVRQLMINFGCMP
jgi:hypothetical protein